MVFVRRRNLILFFKVIFTNMNYANKNQYFIYIMTNEYNTVLYTGVTNDLQRRVVEHRTGKGSRFTSKYKLKKLVYFEAGNDIDSAIFREKAIKGGSRQSKFDLINLINPDWEDLFDKYFV